MQPIVNGLEQAYGAQIAFDRIDANSERGRTLLRKYGLRGHPSYVIGDPEGSKLWSAAGVLDATILEDAIHANLH